MIAASTWELAATWLTAVGTVGAVMVAMGLGLGAWRREDRRRPQLTLSLSPDNTRVEQISDGLMRQSFAVYVRLEVSNPPGKDAAEEAQLLLVSHGTTQPSRWPGGLGEGIR